MKIKRLYGVSDIARYEGLTSERIRQIVKEKPERIEFIVYSSSTNRRTYFWSLNCWFRCLGDSSYHYDYCENGHQE